MFLDDELLQIVKDAVYDPQITLIETYDIFKDTLYPKIMNKCSNKVAGDIEQTRSLTVVQASIKRSFILFDSFINKAKTNSNTNVKQVGFLFEKHSLQKHLLAMPHVAAAYYAKSK